MKLAFKLTSFPDYSILFELYGLPSSHVSAWVHVFKQLGWNAASSKKLPVILHGSKKPIPPYSSEIAYVIGKTPKQLSAG